MDKAYQRNLVKNKLQDYVLNFVYNDKVYKKLIFTGGTALNKLYNLPRLSEDLDFDFPVQFDFDINQFRERLQNYFRSLLQVRLKGSKVAGNQKTIFIKFSAADFLPQSIISPDETVFIRCDFSQTSSKKYKTEVIPFISDEFQFFVLTYDLSTLFANKINAFLERKFFKGKDQKTPFKGRDLFDIYWFINLSARSGFKLKPNWQVIEENFPGLLKEQIVNQVIKKVQQIQKREILNDISAFIEDKRSLSNFIDNYQSAIAAKMPLLT